MKRCPECYQVYGDQERFCEADGHELLADPIPSPKPEVVPTASPAKPVWWPAVTFGVLIGVIFGAGIFAVALFLSPRESNEHPAAGPASEIHERTLPTRVVTASNSVPTPEREASPSPASEQQAEAEQSPGANTENKIASVQLNQGPISTGQKTSSRDSEGTTQTVIEMTDGSTLDVDAAWEDKQGIWYRRSGLVSFVDSSRVKSITARKEPKAAEEPRR
jgi:hypothetical protein